MSAFVREVGKQIGIVAAIIGVGAISVAALPASISAAICGIGGLGYGIYWWSQPSALVPRLHEFSNDTAERVSRVWGSHQLSNGQVAGVVVAAGAGMLGLMQYGTVSAIAGGAAGAMGAVGLMNLAGVVHPVDLPRNPAQFVITPDSILHLDHFCFEIGGVYHGDEQHFNPQAFVKCTSSGAAIECAKLHPYWQAQHKGFFESSGRTADECRAFILSRPLAEIDPHLNEGKHAGLRAYFVGYKFDTLPSTPQSPRPARKPEQLECRQAFESTRGKEIVYPRAQLTPAVIDSAITQAVAQVMRPEALDPILRRAVQALVAAAHPLTGPLQLAQYEAALRANAQTGAHAAAQIAAQEGRRAGVFRSGVLASSALAGARAGVAQAEAALMRGRAMGIDYGQAAGVQAGNLAVIRAAGNPIVAFMQDPVDMAYLLTGIRKQVFAEVRVGGSRIDTPVMQ
jgi:hypothetical protein